MPVKVTNNASSKLSAPVVVSDESFTIQSGEGSKFPTLGTNEFTYVTFGDNQTNEVVKVIGKTGDDFDCFPPIQNNWPIGTPVQLNITAELIDELVQKNANGQIITNLQLQNPSEKLVKITTDSSNLDIDLSLGTAFEVTLTQSVTVNLLNAPDYDSLSIVKIIFKQDGTGGHTVSWNLSVKHSNPSDAVVSSAPNSIDYYELSTSSSGDTWYSNRVGKNFLTYASTLVTGNIDLPAPIISGKIQTIWANILLPTPIILGLIEPLFTRVYYFNGRVSGATTPNIYDYYDETSEFKAVLETWQNVNKSNDLIGLQACASIGDIAYLIGGTYWSDATTPNAGSNNHNSYSLALEAWVAKITLPTPPRHSLSGFSIGTNVYVTSGEDQAVSYSDTDEYNTITEAWTAKTISLGTKAILSGINLGGFGYTMLGSPATHGRYNAGTNSWSAVLAPSSPSAGFNGGYTANGGYGYLTEGILNRRYDVGPPEAWQIKTNILSQKNSHGCQSSDDFIYVYGGLGLSGPSPETYSYDVTGEVWETTTNMSGTARGEGSSATLFG